MINNHTPLNKDSLAEQSAKIIYQNIVNMKSGYEPGSRLNVNVLASELGISETPLKTAFKLLENKGVVIVKSRKGTYVAEISKRDIEEWLELRLGLELLALKLGKAMFSPQCLSEIEFCIDQCEAATTHDHIEIYREMDDRFHQLIVMIANNKRLDNLHYQLITSKRFHCPWSREAQQESINEHKKLLAIFRRGDLEECSLALEVHWEKSSNRALNGYKHCLNSSDLTKDTV